MEDTGKNLEVLFQHKYFSKNLERLEKRLLGEGFNRKDIRYGWECAVRKATYDKYFNSFRNEISFDEFIDFLVANFDDEREDAKRICISSIFKSAQRDTFRFFLSERNYYYSGSKNKFIKKEVLYQTENYNPFATLTTVEPPIDFLMDLATFITSINLTVQEANLLKMLMLEFEVNEIANRLGIKKSTAYYRIDNLRTKLSSAFKVFYYGEEQSEDILTA